ncbi:FixH family protein [Solibacillus isronensis]|uniref:FixH family protein n=1 Tax=Solibacillus isronensis TaxID=412383 RepID=UPI00203F32A3|nr:FixH family protein [Solibacillus isronensis]MCM3723039.1 FixH family protein [Solibacillus isronensis]
MKKWFYSLVAVPFLLVGCGDDPKVETLDTAEVPAIVDVHIQTAEQLNAGETIQLAARVTQDDEAVNDAKEVKFEVWESGLRDEGEMLDGELTEDGIYVADYTFDHDGVYYMFAHTTARGMHVMPKQELIVGNPDMSKVLEDTSSNSMEHDEESSEEKEDDHNH